jgi:hypothetical protein
MAEFRLTKPDEKKLVEQFEKWKNIFNWRIAPLAFGALLAAVSVPDYRRLICALGLIAMIGAWFVAKHEFPKILDDLRKKTDRTFREEILLKGISSYYFSTLNMFKHFGAYLASAVPLAFVMAGTLEKIGL